LYLKMDSVEFDLKEIMTFHMVDGTISGRLDSIDLHSVNIQTGNTDLRIDGTVWNISELLLNGDKSIMASMQLESNWYDFPEFFSFLPEVSTAFPYDIKDISMNLELKTSNDQLTHFNRLPEIDFHISKASAEIDSLFHYGTIEDLDFKMHEKDCVSILDFSGFSIEMDESTVAGDFRYFSNKDQPDSMVVDLHKCAINPIQIFAINESDSISPLIDAWINGGFTCSILFPEDSSLLFECLHFSADNFSYTGLDTVTSKHFTIDSHDISYQQAGDNILSTLRAQNNLDFNELATSSFKTDELEIILEIDKGIYKFISKDSHQFGTEEKGFLEISPFKTPPKFQLDYHIQDLAIENLLTSFYDDSIFTGHVNLDLDLKSEGEDFEEISLNMSGMIHLEGDSLTLYGLDLDNIINNFRRSQSFNLVDIGAVVVAGPAGILYSKGSDYAKILTANKGEMTKITKASSKWNLTDGNINIDDVAFATTENRVAALGWLDMKTDSLDVRIGVIDINGCSIINQRISGSSAQPEYGKVKVFKTLFSPVSKLINNIIDKQCEPFYQGIVQHPIPPDKE